MSKLNVWTLSREDEPEKDVILTSSKGEEFKFRVKVTNELRQALLIDRVAFLTERYITGEGSTPPRAFPPVGDRGVEISRPLIQAACVCEISTATSDDPYTAEEFVALSATRNDVVTALLKEIKGWNESHRADHEDDGDSSEGKQAGDQEDTQPSPA